MARRNGRVADGHRIMGCVLPAIVVTPSVVILTPLAVALSAGCEVVQWCADRTANVADVVAALAEETAELARWVSSVGRTA